MNIKNNEGKLKFNGYLIMNQDKKRNLNNFQRYQYHINESTDMRNKNLENSSPNSSFINNITMINSANQDLINDLNNGKKNMEILVKTLIHIQDEGNSELINISKDISQKIKDLYKYLFDIINSHNEENFKLNIELNKALKENDILRKQVNFLTNEVLKLEELNKENNDKK